MSTTVFGSKPSANDVTEFKAWAKGLSDAIVAMGWLLTTDTGRAGDFSGVVAVPTNDSVWNIFKTNDGKADIFFKIIFSTASANPRPKFQFATGTDGAGTLTGNVSDQKSPAPDILASSYSTYVSGDSSRLSFFLWQDSFVADSSTPIVLQVERAHNDDGTDSDEYFTWVLAHTGGVYFQQSVFKAGVGGVVPGEAQRFMAVVPATNTSGAANSSTWFCPVFPFVGRMGNPMICGCSKTNDIVNATPNTVKFYGTDHSLMFFNQGPTNSAAGTASGFAMRYE